MPITTLTRVSNEQAPNITDSLSFKGLWSLLFLLLDDLDLDLDELHIEVN